MSVSIKGTTGVTAPSFVGDGSNLDNIAFDGVNAAKAWVNFNGVGTIAIRDSFNVSSITDNATGQYAVNFATPMSNANFAVSVTGTAGYTNGGWASHDSLDWNGAGDINGATTTRFNIRSLDGVTEVMRDHGKVTAMVFGN